MILSKCKKKKNKKGASDFGVIGTILVAAIAIIVGLILFTASSQQIGTSVNTVSINKTITAPVNEGIYNFTDYKALNGVTVYNATDGKLIASGNYTITNNQLKDGNLVTTLTVADAQFQNWNWFVISTSAQPLTYIDDGGSRAVTNVILIFLALAVAIVALYPVYQGKLKELIGM